MNDKYGLLVYPVSWETVSANTLRQNQLFGLGTFFINMDEGLQFEKEMNEKDSKYAFWTNSVIPFKEYGYRVDKNTLDEDCPLNILNR